MIKKLSSIEIDERKILRENWDEFIKKTWFTSFERALQISTFLIVLQVFLFFFYDYQSYVSGTWQVTPETRYVFVWRIILFIGLFQFLIIGKKINIDDHESISMRHKVYLYIFVTFIIFSTAVLSVFNKPFIEDISAYTLSIVVTSTMFPFPNRYREYLYIASLLFIFLGLHTIGISSQDIISIFANAASVVAVNIFVQSLSDKNFKRAFVAIKLIQYQGELILLQQELDLKSIERKRTIESVFNFIHNGPLQTLAIAIRYATSLDKMDKKIIHYLNNLNYEIRKINDSLSQEMIDDESSYYLGDQGKVDLRLSFDELLYEVYVRTLDRDFQGFKKLKIKIRSFDTCESIDLPNDIKKSACFFLEEALCNIGKHALEASRLEIIGKLEGDFYTLSVIDNGSEIASSNEGDGTKQIRQIATRLGGEFRRVHLKPKGTLCELKWPLKR